MKAQLATLSNVRVFAVWCGGGGGGGVVVGRDAAIKARTGRANSRWAGLGRGFLALVLSRLIPDKTASSRRDVSDQVQRRPFVSCGRRPRGQTFGNLAVNVQTGVRMTCLRRRATPIVSPRDASVFQSPFVLQLLPSSARASVFLMETSQRRWVWFYFVVSFHPS